jgi:hypothetical protein
MVLIEYKLNKKNKKLGVSAMSIVDEPAIMTNFIKLSKDELKLAVNKEQKIITGPAMIPNIKIYRSAESLGLEEDGYIYFTEDTIKKAAELFLETEQQNSVTLGHEEKNSNLKLIESWIVLNKDNDKAKELGFDIPNGSWMISYKVTNDSLWERIKTGEFRGFSIEASFEPNFINMSDESKKEELVMEPNGGESEEDFMKRCIPHYLDKGMEQEQAIAICISTFTGNKEEEESNYNEAIKTLAQRFKTYINKM